MEKNYDELGVNILWMKKLIFAGVFIQENKLHAIYDRYNELTCKQWLLLAMLQVYPNEAPDLSTLGKQMGCSRQNIKKLAVSLEKDGYIKLGKSTTDSRSLRVYKLEKGIKIQKEMEQMTNEVHNEFFKEFTDDEIKEYYRLSCKIMHGIDNLDTFFAKLRKE